MAATQFDPSTLTADKAEISGVARSSKIDSAPNVVAAVRESRQTGEARQFVVPNSAVKDVVYLVRSAGRRLDVGVRIVLDAKPGNKTAVVFMAKDKKVRLTPEQRAERDAEKAKRKADREAAAKAKAGK